VYGAFNFLFTYCVRIVHGPKTYALFNIIKEVRDRGLAQNQNLIRRTIRALTTLSAKHLSNDELKHIVLSLRAKFNIYVAPSGGSSSGGSSSGGSSSGSSRRQPSPLLSPAELAELSPTMKRVFNATQLRKLYQKNIKSGSHFRGAIIKGHRAASANRALAGEFTALKELRDKYKNVERKQNEFTPRMTQRFTGPELEILQSANVRSGAALKAALDNPSIDASLKSTLRQYYTKYSTRSSP
jgi:hypothetical protein